MKLQDQLHGILDHLSLASTETTLMLGASVLLLAGLIWRKLVVDKVLFGAILLIALVFNLRILEGGYYLSDSLYADFESISLASLFLIFGVFTLVFPREKHSTEYYFLVLALLTGSIFMMKANSFLMVYLSIELVSFVSYLLTGFSFSKKGFEASIKYLLLGALSSAILLIGLGLVYGTTQSFLFSDWANAPFTNLLSQVGLLFVVLGIFFKISIFPFHLWTPATYQTAPVDAVTLFSVVPKIAGLLLLKRALTSASLDFDHWTTSIILLLGIATIAVGTLGALRQSNTRRMISFGSIAHSGFLLGFVIVPAPLYNPEAFWWYVVVYAVMNLGAFYLIDRFESINIIKNEDYAKARSEVWVGVMFSILLVSLVGLPPFAGFTAKLFLFSSLWNAYEATESTLLMVFLMVAVLATVASLFFYLQVPKKVFLPEKGEEEAEMSTGLLFETKILATIFGITLLLLFLIPRLVMSLQSLLHNVHE